MDPSECQPTDPGRARLVSECINKDFYPTVDQLDSSEDSVVNKLYGLMPKNSLMCLLRETVSQLRAATREKEKAKDESLASFIEEKFEALEEKFENKINHLAQANRDAEVVKNSWAQIAETANNTPIDFRLVVKEALETQKKEEAEKDQREMSLIIYRAEESTENDGEKRKQHDKKFFNDMCVDALGIGEVKTKDIRRLGKIEKGKTRPLRITFETKRGKELVIGNAKKLAHAESYFKNTSISYDYSKEERDKIKEKVEEAKEMQKNDLNWVYKVRGPPWDLKIKKFQKHQ